MTKWKYQDISDHASKEFKCKMSKRSKTMIDIATRSSISTPKERPLNSQEQSALRALYCVMEVAPQVTEALSYRLKEIQNSKQRVGIMRWAAGSLFQDVISLIGPELGRRFAVNAERTEMVERQKSIGTLEPWQRIVWEDDLCTVAEAAWRGTCEMCGKSGTEAKKCELKKALDKMQIFDPSDGESGCWWRNM